MDLHKWLIGRRISFWWRIWLIFFRKSWLVGGHYYRGAAVFLGWNRHVIQVWIWLPSSRTIRIAGWQNGPRNQRDTILGCQP